MENRRNKPTINLDILGLRIKVIRVGKSPRLEPQSRERATRMRHIHSHFTYEAFFVTEGALEIVTEDKRTIHERKIVIIPPHIGHYTLSAGKENFCLLFSFDKVSKSEKLRNEILSVLKNGMCELPLSPDVEFYIRALARKSAEGSELAEKDAELLSALIFNELIGLICPKLEDTHRGTRDSKHIGEIETYINSNFQKKITLTDVAEQVFLSTRQVSRIIAKEYGCTLSQLVNDKKLDSAKMMLKNTDMTVGEKLEFEFDGIEEDEE